MNAAAEVAHATGTPLLVVPAGTLNHLARDLGVESVVVALVRVLRQAQPCEVEIDRTPMRVWMIFFGSRTGPLRLARDGETFDGSADFVVAKDDRTLPVYVAVD